jgi:hypothetical protein
MPYTKQTWVDNNLSYPVSAARMGAIENGIEAAAIVADIGHRSLTTTQRDALGAVTTGTMIYNSTTAQIEAYLAGAWVKIPTADDEAYAYIYHNTAVTFAANTNTRIPWSSITNNKNVTLSSGSIVFAKTGVYEVNMGMRLGVGTDVWTGMNFWNTNTSSIMAYGYGVGQVGTNDPAGVSWQMLVNVTSTSHLHDIRIYRAGSTLLTSVPDGNAGWTYTTTVKRLSS